MPEERPSQAEEERRIQAEEKHHAETEIAKAAVNLQVTQAGVVTSALKTVGELVKTHGFVTIFACVCFAILCYFGNNTIETFKSTISTFEMESKARVNKLEEIASESTSAHATGIEVIRANTEQAKEVEGALKSNTRAITKLYGLIKEDPPEE